MGYNINFDDLRNMYEKAISGASMWQGNFSNVMESLNGLVGDAGFCGNAADSIKEYLTNVHVFTMAAIEAMIAEFNAKIILYADGLYEIESDYYAKVNEDYLTSLAGKISDMITYATETHQIVKANADSVAYLVTTDVGSLESYTTSLETAKKTVTDFRDRIGTHDANYAGVNLENLKSLAKNTYDLVQKVHNAGTITIREVDYSEYFDLNGLQELIGQISSAFQYVETNADKIQASADHLTEIRVEINKAIEEQEKKDRITKGIILVGECVLGLVSVVVTCGTDAPFVVAAITGTIGGAVAFDSVAKGIEGVQDIYYGCTGDIETASINILRDTVFKGNQANYDISMMIVNGLYGFAGSMATITTLEHGAWGSAEQITAAELEAIKTVGNTGVDHVTNYFTEKSNMGDMGKFLTSTVAGFAGGKLVDGAGNMLKPGLSNFNSSHFYTHNPERSYNLSFLFEQTVSITDAKKPETISPVVKARATKHVRNRKYSVFGEMSEADGVRYRDWNYEKVYEISIHNPNANSMTLGKYFEGKIELGSYVARAKLTGDTYFSLGSQWDDIAWEYGLSDKEMFDLFNTRALDEAVMHGKTIRFSQDPSDWSGTALGDEWSYLQQKHGYRKLMEKGGYWYAIKYYRSDGNSI